MCVIPQGVRQKRKRRRGPVAKREGEKEEEDHSPKKYINDASRCPHTCLAITILAIKLGMRMESAKSSIHTKLLEGETRPYKLVCP